MTFAKDIYAQVKANHARIDGCKGHTFKPIKHKLGQKHTCLNCGGIVEAPYLIAYIKGWVDAGKDANDVFPGWGV